MATTANTPAPSSAPPPTAWELLQRIWHARFGPHLKWDEAFVIDHSLPCEVVEQAPELGLTLEQVGTVLACWRANMIKSIDEVVVRCKVDAKNLLR